jgi:serine/threonine protein phosphatase PrpC
VEFETAEASLIGNREVNQDRHCVLFTDEEVLLAVCDGMGGHEDGEMAAQTAIDTFIEGFKEEKPNAADAASFMRRIIETAHSAVVRVGIRKPIEQRPRTTVALSIISRDTVRWAHVGDSRIYHIRNGGIYNRTRDHSAVESMFQRGAISESDMQTHPMRNFVEECVGGEPDMPQIDVAEAQQLEAGDIILLCSDGFWGPLDMDEVAKALHASDDLQDAIDALNEQATETASPSSDNATVTAFRLESIDTI